MKANGSTMVQSKEGIRECCLRTVGAIIAAAVEQGEGATCPCGRVWLLDGTVNTIRQPAEYPMSEVGVDFDEGAEEV